MFFWQASLCCGNIIAAKRCGNWMICVPNLLLDPFHEIGAIEATHRLLMAKTLDKISLFQQAAMGIECWQICQHVLLTADTDLND